MANDVTITIQVEGTAEAIAKLGLVGDASKKTANEQSGFWSKLNGSIGNLLGSIPKVGGALAKLGPATIPALPALVAVVGALLGYIASISSELVAAGLGVGAFAALSLPIFKQITAGVTAIGAATTKVAKDKAWDAIPAALQPAVRTILQIKTAWDQMSKSMTPLVGQIAETVGQIVKKLLPALHPLAVEAGQAIETVLKKFDRVASSPGFREFFNQMTRLSGPSIKTIGDGLIQLGGAAAQFLKDIANPQGLQGLKLIFTVIADGLRLLGAQFKIDEVLAREFQGAILLAMHGVLVAVKGAIDILLSAWHGLLDAMSHVPGFGFLKGWATAVAQWKTSFDGQMNGAISKVKEWTTNFNNAPKVMTLQADISQLQAKLYIARQNLNNPELTKTRRAQIQANIANLQAGIATAQRELAALNGQVATTYINTVVNSPIHGPHAETGGIIGAHPSGGPWSGLTMVGEHGRELVRLPPGSYVHSNPDTERIMGQPGGAPSRVVLEVHGGGSEFERFMVQFIRKFVAVRAGGDVQTAFGRG